MKQHNIFGGVDKLQHNKQTDSFEIVDETINIELFELEKVSLNEWYSGKHWSKRQQTKKRFARKIKMQYRNVFTEDYIYSVDYTFNFKTRPLDASNCVAMLKMIEDVLFPNDSFKVVQKISIQSKKASKDSVQIKIQKKSN